MRTEFKSYDGATLVADRIGAGRPLVFLHGGGQTRGSWRRTARTLAERGYETISLDARGHGESDWATGDYDFELFRDDLLAVLDGLEERPAIVGASMGGITGLIAIGESDTSIASALVLVDVATQIARAGAEAIGAFMNGNPEGFASVEEAADAVARYLPHRPRPSDVSGLRRNLREGPDGRLYWHWDPRLFLNRKGDPSTMTPRLEAAARRITVPTMLVRGGRSEIVDEAALQRFREIMPNATIAEVKEAGHMVAGDANTAFGASVIDFLDRVYPAHA